MSTKQEIKGLLESRLTEKLNDPECQDSTLKLALEYLKVFKVEDADGQIGQVFTGPTKGMLKEFIKAVNH